MYMYIYIYICIYMYNPYMYKKHKPHCYSAGYLLKCNQVFSYSPS